MELNQYRGEIYRILITGACGVTSRSVVRSLNESKFFANRCEFIGTDICYNLYGIYEGLYRKVYKVPKVKDSAYRNIMQRIISENHIEYAIIIPEPEVLYWCRNPFDVKFLRIPPRFAEFVLSKLSLYELLEKTSLVPKYQMVDKKLILNDTSAVSLNYPMWIRDYAEGTTSGTGSFSPKNYEQLKAWLIINEHVDTFMLSEYLPGKNLADFLLYNNGKLLKYGVAQRIDYLMAKVAVSRITGNTSRGKLLNYPKAHEVARKAVETIIEITGEQMNGLVVVDMKEDEEGNPKVTEINIRHVAFTSIFANAGFNFSEYQMLILIGREDKIPVEQTMLFPENNLMLRDVDGLPIYIDDFKEMEETF
jgi:carbamoyl-phosphate synthase large subunit